MKRPAVIATILSAALSIGVIVYVASIGGFGPSNMVISDPIEGAETTILENPEPPNHPAFPSSNVSAAERNATNSTS